MKKILFKSLGAFLMMAVSAIFMSASAATVSLNPTADGSVKIFGTDDVNTTGTSITFSQSGSNIRNAILEFDLSAIADGSTINSVSLDLVLTGFVSTIGANPADVDILAYGGDGVIDLIDFNVSGTSVFSGTTPDNGSAGDVRSFSFTTLTPIADALALNLLTLRLETNSFDTIRFASLENSNFSAASLNINFTPLSVVPLPAALPLYGTGLALMGFIGWRRKQRKAAA